MTNNFDTAIEIATWNDEGDNAAICDIAEGIDLLVCDSGQLFILRNHRPNAKRTERTVSGDWAYKFLTRAVNVTVHAYAY